MYLIIGPFFKGHMRPENTVQGRAQVGSTSQLLATPCLMCMLPPALEPAALKQVCSIRHRGPLSPPQMLSNMRYHTSVIISLFGAMGTLGSSSRKLMKLGAYAERIREMERVMKEIKAGGATGGWTVLPAGCSATCAAAPLVSTSAPVCCAGSMGAAEGQVLSSEDAIVFEEAVVVTPGNATLVRDLSLRVPAGTNLLVTGPNGAGKSSMFR